MTWSASKIFTAYINNTLTNVTAIDLDTDALFKVSLFNDTPTPSQIVAAAASAYNTGVWAANFVFDASGWPQVGRDLVTKTVSAETATTFKWDADDTVSANSTTTLTAAFGCLIYDDTIATPVIDQGVCYNYFGGTNSVTSGTFTVVWNGAGILTIAV